MSETQTYEGMEVLEPDGYLQPKRYRIRALCTRCDHEFSWIATKLDGKDRPCPRKACREAVLEEEVERRAYNLAKMLDEQRAPGHIGANVQVRAIDTTAEIVMADHNLTDLKDNIRVGEAMAPKLPPQMQKAADGFFGGNGAREGIGASITASTTMAQRQAMALGHRAISGAFRSMSLNPGQVMGKREPGEAALRSVGVEKLHGS